MKIQDCESLREKYPNTMSISTAAGVIGTGVKRLEISISRDRANFPYVVDLSMPDENRPRYRVITERFIAYMQAIDMQSEDAQNTANEKMVREITSSVFKQLAEAIK